MCKLQINLRTENIQMGKVRDWEYIDGKSWELEIYRHVKLRTGNIDG